jgi:two-component system nitrogen regulation response regulator NtrX
MSPTVLVVDDQESIRKSLRGILGDEGYKVVVAGDHDEAMERVRDDAPDLVLLDIWMPGPDGLEVLKKIKAELPDMPVIIISGHGTIETAVKATKLGAYDFIEKPLSTDKVLLTVSRALEHRRLTETYLALRARMVERGGILGRSELINKLRADIDRVAPTDGWVLITGENGTGKELVARQIHFQSNRRNLPFVDVNCAAIPEELIESELFGHEKGSFTGATERKRGKFDLAHRGSIFLDEIADMSLKTQAKILRILQEQKFERVGGAETIQVDVRVIVATNKNLLEEIAAGRFREDLYYRLNVIPLHVPPLRERAEDIPLFIDHFIAEYSRKMGVKKKRLDPQALNILSSYNWPGNVRELKNIVERTVIMTPGPEITVRDLPPAIISEVSGESTEQKPYHAASLKEARDVFEKEYLTRKLRENGGNVSKTAEAIGLERSSLHRKIKSYGIDTEKL